MILFWIDLIILLLGYGAFALLFWRIPFLPRTQANQPARLSVIIPARNEEKTLPLLLRDLLSQSLPAHEIIVVNDDSQDETEAVARAFGVQVISLHDKPNGWVGKNWACQAGAAAATGDALVFLDADVRLSSDGLSRISGAYSEFGAVSVQPYHATERLYEQAALLFNLLLIGANGSALPNPIHFGLFGPVIALSRTDYFAAGGHESVKSAVVEDMALAGSLRRAKIPFHLFMGDVGIRYRMYPDGFGALWNGFTKNFATCATKIPVWLFFLVALFFSSFTSAPLNLILTIVSGGSLVWLYAALYALWVVVLFRLVRRIGRFHPLAVVLYPLPLLVFFAVFVNSCAIRLFRGKVKWKGRAIELER